jgi:hypothetical protein
MADISLQPGDILRIENRRRGLRLAVRSGSVWLTCTAPSASTLTLRSARDAEPRWQVRVVPRRGGLERLTRALLACWLRLRRLGRALKKHP